MDKLINIDGSELTINYPSSWNEMTVKEYILLNEILEKQTNTLLLITEYLEALNGGMSLRRMKNSDFQDIIKSMTFIKTELPKDNQITKVTIDGQDYNLIDFKELTVAESIDLSFLMEQGDPIKNLGKFFCIVLRKPLEEWNTKLWERESMFLNIPVSSIIYAFNFFLHIKKK